MPDEVIALLKVRQPQKISLDHDLADDARGTGYDAVLWMKEAAQLRMLAGSLAIKRMTLDNRHTLLHLS